MKKSHSETTDVLIDGKVYSVSGQDPEYIRKVAQFIGETLQEVRLVPGYKRLTEEYQALLLNLNLADACLTARGEAEKLQEEAAEKERELYALKHDMVGLRLKLEAALKQQERMGERSEEWKKKYEELKGRQHA